MIFARMIFPRGTAPSDFRLGSNDRHRVLVDQVLLVLIVIGDDERKVVEGGDFPQKIGAIDQVNRHWRAIPSGLIEKTILDIQRNFWHFPPP